MDRGLSRQLANTIHTVKQSSGSIVLWDLFQLRELVNLSGGGNDECSNV